MKVPAANPLEVDRVNAMNLALRDETGATHVIVSPQCQELITDLEQVLADPRGGLKKTYNQKDPYSRRTHTSDCLSYWVTAEAPVKAMRPQGTAPVQVKAAGYGVAR
jgi:hypothetical protein